MNITRPNPGPAAGSPRQPIGDFDAVCSPRLAQLLLEVRRVDAELAREIRRQVAIAQRAQRQVGRLLARYRLRLRRARVLPFPRP